MVGGLVQVARVLDQGQLMEAWAHGRQSGKTTRAVLWLLQNWEDGIIVCPTHMRTLHTRTQARDLTGLPGTLLVDRIITGNAEEILTRTTTKHRLLLEDIDDFHPYDRQGIELQREVVAYTC